MVSLIAFVISALHPAIPHVVVNSYAQAIEEQSTKIEVDGLTFVSIIEHESGWDPKAVSPDGEDFGLMQVRARYFKGEQTWLFNPLVNIKAGAHVIKASKDLCREHLGREPELEEWMSCYTGSCGYAKSFCRSTKLTKVMANYQACLVDHLNYEDMTPWSDCRKKFVIQ